MKADVAEHEIAVMTAVVETLEGLERFDLWAQDDPDRAHGERLRRDEEERVFSAAQRQNGGPS
jgi:hypothetical protein